MLGLLSFLPRSTEFRYELALPSQGRADISIVVSPMAVSSAQDHRIIDTYNNIPEHQTTWHGHPADLGVLPCTTPSGPCSGFVGGFTVVVGRTWYDVFLFSMDQQVAWRAIRSIRIVQIV